MMDSNLLEALGRREGERARALGWLVRYAELQGGERSLRKLAVIMSAEWGQKGGSLRACEKRLMRWSKRYEWQARVEAYDKAVVEQRAAAWLARQEEVRERDWLEGEALRKKGMAALEELEVVGRGAVGQAAGLVEKGSRLQRLATGEPTERTAVDAPGWLEILEKVYGSSRNNPHPGPLPGRERE